LELIMTDVTPSGPVAVPIYLLRRMVAKSPTFRAMVGQPTTVGALPFVHVKEVDDQETRPCAVICTEGTRYTVIAGGAQIHLRPQGEVFLYLALDTLAEHFEDPSNAFMRFANFYGGVMEDIAGMSGADQTEDTTFPDSDLAITGIRDLPVMETPQALWESVGRYWLGAMVVSWGDQ